MKMLKLFAALIFLSIAGSIFGAAQELFRAIEANNKREVELWLKKGISVNLTDKYGKTLLMKASEEGKEEIVKLLLHKGADVNLRDNGGWTALMVASEGGREGIVKLLLDKGANVNLKDNGGHTALLMLISRDVGYDRIVELLLKGADVNLRDSKGQTALMIACSGTNERRVKLLLAHGADVNLQDNDGNTALMFAFIFGSERIVKLLFAHDVDVNLRDDYGDTISQSLTDAARRDWVEIVKLLFDRGANVNWIDMHGRSALMWACLYGREEIVKLLLHKGADLNLQDQRGRTALMDAIVANNENIARLLINSGAQVNLENSKKETALSIAEENPKIRLNLQTYSEAFKGSLHQQALKKIFDDAYDQYLEDNVQPLADLILPEGNVASGQKVAIFRSRENNLARSFFKPKVYEGEILPQLLPFKYKHEPKNTEFETSLRADGDAQRITGAKNSLEVLGLSENPSAEQIKTAYHKLALKLHPDKWSTASLSDRNYATELFQKIAKAYEQLKGKV